MVIMSGGPITVLLADDNLIVREGVRALLGIEADFEVVAVAADYDELIARAEEHVPHVLVTDIRMPPNFQSEGIDAAKEVRKRNPGTGVVILGGARDGKATLVVTVTKDLAGAVDANAVVKRVEGIIEGRGGGRPESASAGGKAPARLGEAVEAARTVVKERLNGGRG